MHARAPLCSRVRYFTQTSLANDFQFLLLSFSSTLFRTESNGLMATLLVVDWFCMMNEPNWPRKRLGKLFIPSTACIFCCCCVASHSLTGYCRDRPDRTTSPVPPSRPPERLASTSSRREFTRGELELACFRRNGAERNTALFAVL